MEERNIMKPLSVAYSDFIDALYGVINKSMLPPFIIESVLHNILNDIHNLSQKQIKIDAEAYSQTLNKLHKNGDDCVADSGHHVGNDAGDD